jgi:hypothetical protein
MLGVSLLFASGPAFAATPAPAHAPVKVRIDGRELFDIGFSQLSAFDYTIVDAGTGATPAQIAEAEKRDQVPDWVHFYQDKPVILTGYLMPLQVENGVSKKFIIMKDVTTCCYGAVPNMNDYVVVTMKGDGVKAVQDVPVALIGVFHVAQKYENGYVTSLFQLDGEKFLGPKK